MLIKTLDHFREHKQIKAAMFIVRWLPYVDSPFAIHDRGTEEHVYTTIKEAQDFFDRLCLKESQVERASLHKIVYPSGGGYATPLLDEWQNPIETVEE